MDTENQEVDPDVESPDEKAEADASAEAYWQHAMKLFAKIRADEMTAEECAKELFMMQIESEDRRGVVESNRYTPRERLRVTVQSMSTFVDARKMQSLFKKAGF
jgi:hypothetical protein